MAPRIKQAKEKKDKKTMEMKKPEDDSQPSHRNWLSLPDILLIAIIDCLTSIPDLLAFTSVSRSLRSLRRSVTSFPPLLLHPIAYPSLWPYHPHCYIQTTDQDRGTTRFYKPSVSSRTLWKQCTGYSHGHLIFAFKRKITLADIFTGAEITAPDLPENVHNHVFYISILTAPVSSASCMLVLVTFSRTYVWKLGSDVWVEEEYLRYYREIMALAVVEGKVFCLESNLHLKVVCFDPKASWKTIEVQSPNWPEIHKGKFENFLVECEGEILMVLFMRRAWPNVRIDVYRLDMLKLLWVKTDSIGDACLFLDAVGNCPIVCPNPSRWGGRSNCVYITGSGCRNWVVFPLDGNEIDTSTCSQSALRYSEYGFPRWPSPVWVYPSMLSDQ